MRCRRDSWRSPRKRHLEGPPASADPRGLVGDGHLHPGLRRVRSAPDGTGRESRTEPVVLPAERADALHGTSGSPGTSRPRCAVCVSQPFGVSHQTQTDGRPLQRCVRPCHRCTSFMYTPSGPRRIPDGSRTRRSVPPCLRRGERSFPRPAPRSACASCLLLRLLPRLFPFLLRYPDVPEPAVAPGVHRRVDAVMDDLEQGRIPWQTVDDLVEHELRNPRAGPLPARPTGHGPPPPTAARRDNTSPASYGMRNPMNHGRRYRTTDAAASGPCVRSMEHHRLDLPHLGGALRIAPPVALAAPRAKVHRARVPPPPPRELVQHPVRHQGSPPWPRRSPSGGGGDRHHVHFTSSPAGPCCCRRSS